MPPDSAGSPVSTESMQADARALAAKVIAGERSAIAQALNQVDDNRPAYRERSLTLLDALAETDGGIRIGVTGAPGAGKSTLLDVLVSGLRARDRSVGVLAVDPSSQRTGGALLGDRMRLSSSARDSGVFLRSLAARDALGGLSEVTGPSLDVMSSALDFVFVETVGVGQSEAQVTDLVDTLVFVAQPAAGDLIQFMKAGILEWPDLFFVNKADLGAIATRSATELRAGIDLGNNRDPNRTPPVLCGSARDGVGIEELIDAIEEHSAYLTTSGQAATRRAGGRVARIGQALQTRYGRFGMERLLATGSLEQQIKNLGKMSVDRAIDELGRQIESALGSDNGR